MLRERTKSLWVGILLGSIFCAALFMRLNFLQTHHHTYDFSRLTLEHGVLAHNFLHGYGFLNNEKGDALDERQQAEKRLIDPEEFKDELDPRFNYASAHEVPGYALLLATTWEIFGQEKYIYLQIIQIVIDSLMVFLIYWIGKTISRRRRVGIVSSFLFLVFIPEARISIVALRDVWATFILLSLIALTLYAQSSNQPKKRLFIYCALGFVYGLGLLIHPMLQFFLPFIALSIAMSFGVKEAFRTIFFSGIVVFIVLFPWIHRNYHYFQKVIPTRDVQWQGIWESFGQFSDNPFGARASDDETCEDIKKKASYIGPCWTPHSTDVLRTMVMAAVQEYPEWSFMSIIRRMPHFFSVSFTWTLPFLEKNSQPLPESISSYFSVVLQILAATSLFFARSRSKEYRILFFIPIYLFFLFLPLHIESRYFVSLFVVYSILAASSIVSFSEIGIKYLHSSRSKR